MNVVNKNDIIASLTVMLIALQRERERKKQFSLEFCQFIKLIYYANNLFHLNLKQIA